MRLRTNWRGAWGSTAGRRVRRASATTGAGSSSETVLSGLLRRACPTAGSDGSDAGTTGLPRPQIATKLYGTIAVMLAVVYVLAGATIRFAAETGQTSVWAHDVSLRAVEAAGQLEDTLDQLRRLVVTPPSAPAGEPPLWESAAFLDLNRNAASYAAAMGLSEKHPLSAKLADLQRDGALVLALVSDQRSADAAAAAQRYAEASEDLSRSIVAERQRKTREAAEIPDQDCRQFQLPYHLGFAAAAASGLVIGPIGLLLLRRC